VSLTTPTEGSTFTAPTNIVLQANATSTSGTIAKVDFYAGSVLIGTATLAPYQITWKPVTGSYSLSAKATDNAGVWTRSSKVNISVAGPPAVATFVTVDSTTQGNWKGAYGKDGYLIVGDATSLPTYVGLTAQSQGIYTWTSTTSELRALQKAASSDRLAAAWYSGNFTINLNFVDGETHGVTMYVLDWDSTVRSETIQILDGTSGTVLDTRTVTGFNGGQYWVWNLRGQVTIRVTVIGGPNAVVSGLFFGGAGNVPPSVTMTSPVEGATFAAPASIPLAASASSPAGSISSVGFYSGSTLLGTVTTPPYQATWSSVPAGVYTFGAVATDNTGTSTTSVPVHVTVTSSSPTASATFRRVDSTTQGNWKGVYGADGYMLVNGGSNLPSYGTVSQQGAGSYTWTTSTADVRALQAAVGTNRFVAAWYGSTFTIDLNLTDNLSHRIGLYVLDWDSTTRAEKIDILDAANGTPLDTRTATAFNGGQYLVWTIKGHVTIRLTLTGGANALVNALFFDPSTAP
jgi:hypothetical protein